MLDFWATPITGEKDRDGETRQVGATPITPGGRRVKSEEDRSRRVARARGSFSVAADFEKKGKN